MKNSVSILYVPLLEKDDVFVFKIVVIAERVNAENEVII